MLSVYTYLNSGCGYSVFHDLPRFDFYLSLPPPSLSLSAFPHPPPFFLSIPEIPRSLRDRHHQLASKLVVAAKFGQEQFVEACSC